MHIHIVSKNSDLHLKLITSLRSIGHYVTVGPTFEKADYTLFPSEEQPLVLGEHELALITDTVQKASQSCAPRKK